MADVEESDCLIERSWYQVLAENECITGKSFWNMVADKERNYKKARDLYVRGQEPRKRIQLRIYYD